MSPEPQADGALPAPEEPLAQELPARAADATPVVFYRDGELTVYAHGRESGALNRWLFERSRLYRTCVGLTHSNHVQSVEAAAQEVRGALLELARMVEADGSTLTVLIQPFLQPVAEWAQWERAALDHARGILDDSGIAHIDLTPVTEHLLKEGIHVWETEGDTWHPGAEAAGWYARALMEVWSPLGG